MSIGTRENTSGDKERAGVGQWEWRDVTDFTKSSTALIDAFRTSALFTRPLTQGVQGLLVKHAQIVAIKNTRRQMIQTTGIPVKRQQAIF